MSLWQDIQSAISAATGEPFVIASRAEVSGGCINACYRVGGGGRDYFVKTNDAGRAAMFSAEADGLAEIAATGTVRVPRPICHGANDTASWIVLEHIVLGRSSAPGMRRLGRELADLHRTTVERYGWHRDNTIGSTPQINTPGGSWVSFWREHRLGFQLALAARNGYGGELQRGGARLTEKLPAFFTTYTPAPSLLHGDLWSGNAAFDTEGAPVILDPAAYYGDREADLAMTELFGGFPAAFYDAYRGAWPLDAGYAVRRDLYNLYHVLNHLNLFGGGYLQQSERLIDKLLAEA